MEEGEHDKSELPTPYKLQKSREKGMVARGMDLGFLTGLAGLLATLWATGPWLATALGEASRRTFLLSEVSTDRPGSLMEATALLFLPVAKCVALILITVFLLVLLFEIVQTGFVFSAHSLRPDFSRLSPGKGLKRIFSMRLLIEMLKNILKLATYATISFLVIRAAFSRSGEVIHDGSELARELRHVGAQMLGALSLVQSCLPLSTRSSCGGNS